MGIDWRFLDVVVEETTDTVLLRDGNGALLRRHKHHDTTPEHVDFSIKTREDWNVVREKLTAVDEGRINCQAYREARAHAKANGKPSPIRCSMTL